VYPSQPQSFSLLAATLANGLSFSTVRVGWSFFSAFSLATISQEFNETTGSFVSVAHTLWIAWTALACGHVCQRLGKTEGKICAGLLVLAMILCQSQILAHRKKF